MIFDFSGSAIGRVISYCNPLAGIVTGIREIILVGNISTWSHLLLPAAQSCIVFIVGYAVFRRYERRFIDVL